MSDGAVEVNQFVDNHTVVLVKGYPDFILQRGDNRPERSHVAKGIGGNEDGLTDGDMDADGPLVLTHVGTSHFSAVGPAEGVPEILLGGIFPGMLGDGDFQQPVGAGH